jgi:hypothetical protein
MVYGTTNEQESGSTAVRKPNRNASQWWYAAGSRVLTRYHVGRHSEMRKLYRCLSPAVEGTNSLVSEHMAARLARTHSSREAVLFTSPKLLQATGITLTLLVSKIDNLRVVLNSQVLNSRSTYCVCVLLTRLWPLAIP